jgi:hypothetical protein
MAGKFVSRQPSQPLELTNELNKVKSGQEVFEADFMEDMASETEVTWWAGTQALVKAIMTKTN